MEHALDVSGLSMTYGSGPGAVEALSEVGLRLARGSFTALMGPSGSGKSTFLNCVAGLERPRAGTITIGGRPLPTDEAEATVFRRERIGIVFQGLNLLPYLTAGQNVELPLRLAGGRVPRDLARDLLEEVGLGDRLHSLPSELSGGQRQRVAIARGLVTRPDVLFADEPTGALDSRSARNVLGILRGSADRLGQTIVMVTHDPVAAAYADQVVFLADGRIAGQMSNPTPEAVAAQMTHLDQLVPASAVPTTTKAGA
ncbi:ABC transporter ATP-binding protein [Kineosporia succinea]|uniref:ABC transport system ATP-binding protein n=1 Tax=Kineosporia succinea TaxID=84632 RepID=A0ABT9P0G6_9ACTN|nr:ABC transporter ATP-binding protein [Kineosporia succinea]MDP9826168.1 putative ABC transport system ATP-binding protein [Kineosporia succinea]